MGLRELNDFLAETIYSIGAGGLTPVKTGRILIQPGVTYHMGASSSPNMIFVTNVDDRFIWYKTTPFYRSSESKIDRRSGEHLIWQGVQTFLKGPYVAYPWGKKIEKKYRALIGGKEVKPEKLSDYQRMRVVVGPTEKTVGQDFWRHAESYGNVTGKRIPVGSGFEKSRDLTYEIEMDKKVVGKIRKDKNFHILDVETI